MVYTNNLGQTRVGVRNQSVVTSLLLDIYSGSAAAYSLRKLSNSYTGSAIRVRRSSDNTELNIGFDGGGDLDTASLLSFIGSNNQTNYSEEFDNVYWNKYLTTVTSNQAIAPDGTTSADLLAETSANNYHTLWSNTLSYSVGTSWNISCYVKKGPGTTAPNTIILGFPSPGTNIFSHPCVLFNISSGTVLDSSNTSNDSNFGSSIVDVGNGWWRCSVWGTVTATGNRSQVGVIRFNNNLNTLNTSLYPGSSQSNIYIWGYQCQRALNDTSVLTTQPYTKTVATSNTGNGFVTTWFDQSGNGRNATQTTAANQPQIVLNGSSVLMNNKPSVSFATSNMTFTQIAGVSGLDIFVVSNFTNVTGGGQNWNIVSPILAETSGNIQDFVLGAKSSKMSIWTENNNTSFIQTTSTISINTPYIYNGYGSSTSVGVGFNGGNYVTGAGRRNDLIVRALGKDAASTQFTGNLSEVIVYTSIQSSNRPNINSEINSYYSIY